MFLALTARAATTTANGCNSNGACGRRWCNLRRVMKYNDTNQLIRVGDSVLYAGAPGVIVFVIDDDSYSERYPKKDWSYLGKGLGVEIQDKERTLYHLETTDEDLKPVSAGKSQTLPTL